MAVKSLGRDVRHSINFLVFTTYKDKMLFIKLIPGVNKVFLQSLFSDSSLVVKNLIAMDVASVVFRASYFII